MPMVNLVAEVMLGCERLPMAAWSDLKYAHARAAISGS